MLTRREACKQVAGIAAATAATTIGPVVMASNIAKPSPIAPSTSPRQPMQRQQIHHKEIWARLDITSKIGTAIKLTAAGVMPPQQARELLLTQDPSFAVGFACAAMKANIISKEEARKYILDHILGTECLFAARKMAILVEAYASGLVTKDEVYQLAGIHGSPQTNLV